MMHEFDTQISNVLFLLFVRVVDEDKSIGLRDIEKFDRLIENPESVNLNIFQASLASLRKNYSQLWASYRKGLIGKENEEITQALDAIDFHARAESWLEWRDGFIKYVNYFAVDSGLASKLISRQEFRKNRIDQVGLISLLLMNWKPMFARNSFSDDIDTLELERDQLLTEIAKSIKSVLLNFTRESNPHGSVGSVNQHLICIDVTKENDFVSTYSFATQNQHLWAFQPGQFLTFDIPHDDKWVRRSYSISSSPSRPYFLEVTVKKIEDGYVSNWFHENVITGKELVARGPHGQFSLFNAKQNKLLFMVAGVGITPIMSMLRWIVDTHAPQNVIVFNRIHSLEDAIFLDDLIGIEKRSKGKIRIITMTTLPSANWPDSLNVLESSSSRLISREMISSLAPDLDQRSVFLCGPDSFVSDVKSALSELNFDLQKLHFESFAGLNQSQQETKRSSSVTSPTLTGKLPTNVDQDNAADLQCEIEFKRSGVTVLGQQGDNLLDIAELYGVDIANSCRMGSCGSCKCVKISGDIAMHNTDGLSEADKLSQHVLLCVGTASSSRIVLDA
jgi:ferredoxin-NADP reductase